MALATHADVRAVDVDLRERTVEVLHVGDPSSASEILGALERTGMAATLLRSGSAGLEAGWDEAGWDEERRGAKDAGGTGPAPAERRTLVLVLVINAAMFVVELVTGLLAQSTGLVADSLDMLGDASVYAIALLAVGSGWHGQRRAARTSGWLQLALAALVLVDVVRRATTGSEPLDAAMVGIGMLALAANVTCLVLLSAHRRGGPHMRASWIFTTNDVVANLGVILAGALVALTGSALPDLIVGTAISLLVASGAWRILRMP